MKTLFFTILLLLLTTTAHAWPARVVSVADGDTITVEPAQGGDRVKVRLYGIDCPESRQPYGQTAKGLVNNAVLFQEVDIDVKNIDRYKRSVAIVTLSSGTTLQQLLLESGLTWVYDRYCKNCQLWKVWQAEAKAKRIGLWSDPHPVPPWEWRKANK